jgi:hypothetical protein
MATTAVALSDKQLEAELQTKRRELDKLQERLRGETRTLDAAKGEHGRVVVAIENGATGKEHELARAKESVETAEIRVGGVRKQLASIEVAIEELKKEIYRRELAANKAAREKDKAQRFEKGRTLALRIRETLALLCTDNMRELEELCGSLVIDFPDTGGVQAASALREILMKPAGPNEKLRHPEVHLAQLEAAGLVQFGFYADIGMVRGTVQGIPDRQVTTLRAGAPVRLTVVAMRPRE